MVNVKREEGCSEPQASAGAENVGNVTRQSRAAKQRQRREELQIPLAKKNMYPPYKHRGSRRHRGFKFLQVQRGFHSNQQHRGFHAQGSDAGLPGQYRQRYTCQKETFNFLHGETLNASSKEGEENTFPLEHMVVIDQTEDDLPYENAASPASCDSSDSENAACASDSIPRSPMVILDETNDDNDTPASPASCDSSPSEYAPSSSEVRAGTSKKSTSKEPHAESPKTRHGESKKTFHLEPIKSSQDVFQFLKTFAIANDSDLEFANKVKEMFSSALRKYKEIQLEEIICTEAEHSSPEELEGPDDGSSDHEKGHSISQVTIRSRSEKTNSAPSSPKNSSPAQCISIPMSSADSKEDSPILNQSDNPDTSSIASQSPTNQCEEIDTSNKPSTTNSTNDNSCSVIEADLLMESEDCVTAEAACSDDDV